MHRKKSGGYTKSNIVMEHAAPTLPFKIGETVLHLRTGKYVQVRSFANETVAFNGQVNGFVMQECWHAVLQWPLEVILNQGTRAANVPLHGVWLPCEFIVKNRTYHIVSLGDIEATRIEVHAPCLGTLFESVEQFFASIPDDKHLVVLAPNGNLDSNTWSTIRVLKGDIIALPRLFAAPQQLECLV